MTGIIFLCLLAGSQASPKLLNDPGAILVAWLASHSKTGPSADFEQTENLLSLGELLYLEGGSQSAAARLGAAFLDPSYAEHRSKPIFDNIRYTLASSLLNQGAFGQARKLLLELIVQVPPSVFRPLAFRKFVDLTLISDQFEQSLTLIKEFQSNTKDLEQDEVSYLQGKALFRLDFYSEAIKALSRVGRKSRLFAAATYLAGLIHLSNGHPDAAESSFCTLVNPSGGSTYFLSRNVERIIEQAWLALARIRHDRGDYLRAAETYRRIPSHSVLASRARYELAWSLFRSGQMPDSRNELTRLLNSPVVLDDEPSAKLLLGYTYIKECMFERAIPVLEDLSEQLGRIGTLVAAGNLPPEAEHWVAFRSSERRLVALEKNISQSVERNRWAWSQLLFVAGRPQATAQYQRLRILSEQIKKTRFRVMFSKRQLSSLATRKNIKSDGIQITKTIKRLSQHIASLEKRIKRSEIKLEQLFEVSLRLPDSNEIPSRFLELSIQKLNATSLNLKSQKNRTEDIMEKIQKYRIRRMTQRLSHWSRQVQLGKIDTILGRKQTLQLEIQNLALSKYPLSLLQVLAEAGVLDEQTEYWPYDGEYWPDEYDH
jgi:tetratricopeptide (TPR) repeat protein